MKRKLKILLAAAMALLLAIAPCALAETAYHASLIRFPTKLVGFASENTPIFSAPTEFSARIAVGCGFPLYVTGSAGQFYIVENAATVRAAAKMYGISKSTVHKDVTVRLRETDRILHGKVLRVLEENKTQRHLRGGMATKRKYEELARIRQEAQAAHGFRE